MLKGVGISGASRFFPQPDSPGTSRVPEAPARDVSPAATRLLGPAVLPQTPPSQMLRTASEPPPIRRRRKMACPPAAPHPKLSCAITVARTVVPDACHSPNRLPTHRQIRFPFPNPPHVQQASPFATAVHPADSASLLENINSLPGPKDLLRTVLTQTKHSLSFQDSGMLTQMLHRANRLQSERQCSSAPSSSSACRYCLKLSARNFLAAACALCDIAISLYIACP